MNEERDILKEVLHRGAVLFVTELFKAIHDPEEFVKDIDEPEASEALQWLTDIKASIDSGEIVKDLEKDEATGVLDELNSIGEFIASV